MKLNNVKMDKTAARNFRNEYIAMMDEVARRRKVYQQAIAAIHTAENEVIADMFRQVASLTDVLGRCPSAAEITRAMGGRMSRHEVVGQLTVALGEHYNGMGLTKNATHEPTQAAKGKVKANYIRQRKTFAEVDKSGALVEGGQTITTETLTKTYGIRRGE